MSNRGTLLALVASLGITVVGCGAAELPPPSTPIVTNPTSSPSTVAAATTPTDATPQAAAPVAQAPAGVLFCSATADGNTREVYLDWKGDTASGTLRTSAAGVVKDEAVKAERTKARVVLADAAAKATAPKANAPKATIVLKGDAKKIQVGDGKQPWTSCR